VADYEPAQDVADSVRSWVQALAYAPWQAPSVPVPELSRQPFYETREALLPFGVYVVYQQDYQTGTIDLVMVLPAE
jgi:hypothetical protein